MDGNFVIDILPGTIFFGLGGGITFNPLLLAAMGDVKPMEAGLASGVVNTSFMFGGALGLAVLASLAAWRTDDLLASGDGQLGALLGGYHFAFVGGAIFAAVAATIGRLLLRPVAPPMHGMEDAPPRAGACARDRSLMRLEGVTTGAASSGCGGRRRSPPSRERERGRPQTQAPGDRALKGNQAFWALGEGVSGETLRHFSPDDGPRRVYAGRRGGWRS